MPARDLTCRELVEIVTEYLEGTLPARERARFETHLLDCPGCTTYLDQMRETIRLTGRLGDGLAPSVRDELLAAFRDWKRGP
ncbi:MAG: zf-HC2 domain-containing protein [Actinomycetota bacterium]|nr:zf-HC2 domain-containing protein [Actinomycetota bacterium]